MRKNKLLLLFFLARIVLSVNREDFKMCDQSAFCKRHRTISKPSGYVVVLESFKWKDSLATAVLTNHENITLELRIYGLEKEFHSMAKKADKTVLIAGDRKSKVVVYHKPFMIEIFNERDEPILQINKNGKLMVEEFRQKEDGKEYPEGFWEESFKHHRDSKPFGSSSVGVDVSFVGFTHAFGLPEHADSFALKETDGHSDPYRLYNLDVFEYELHNPMALYVAVPYIVAHRSDRSVGVLWLNSAETWIDTSSSSGNPLHSILKLQLNEESDTNFKTCEDHFDAHFISETGLIDIFVFSGPEVTMDKDCRHYGDIEHREIHNMYGMLYHSASFDGQLQRNAGRYRPFILTRSGFVGSQRSAAIWTGDNAADWEHLAISTPMLLSLSIAGNSFVGADVGGFFGNPDEQLLIRWYQTGAFQPFFRAHAHIETRRREPWLFSEETRLAIREAIRRRYKLLPYWYTLFHEHLSNGAPVMRPMWYEFPTEENLFAEEKQWLVGNALLVRPVVDKDADSVEVNLPDGTRWFDWETGMEYGAGLQTVAAPITAIPGFQRGGTIVPTWQRVRRSTAGMIDDPLTLFVALDRQNSANGSVYLDDGKTYAYQTDAQFAIVQFNYETISTNQALITGDPREDGHFEAKNWLEKIVIRGVKQIPSKVTFIRALEPSEELEFDYKPEEMAFIIGKLNVVVATKFLIKILF